MPPVLAGAADVTPAWLTALLRERGLIARGARGPRRHDG